MRHLNINENKSHFILPFYSKAVDQSCSVKKVFLEISQNSKENTCARVYYERNSGTGVFLWILRNFQEHLSYRTPMVAVSIYQCVLQMLLFYNLRVNSTTKDNFKQKQSPEVLCKKRCSEKTRKIVRKAHVPEPQPATLLKKRLWQRYRKKLCQKKETLTQVFSS